MRLVTFDAGQGERVGALLGADRVLDLAAAGRMRGIDLPLTMLELIERGAALWAAARDVVADAPIAAAIALDTVALRAPLPRPPRLRDCSLFLEHMEAALHAIARRDAGREADPQAAYERLIAEGRCDLKPVFRERVVYYNADHLHVVGPDTDVIFPPACDEFDYELEWACIVGKGGSDIPRATAREHIFGYTIFNDWSARDLQLPFMAANLGPGGGKDFANGLGPCIATPDEFADPYALSMCARVNGESWSCGSTASMHHTFEDAIAEFSALAPLVPGEVIGSGTVLNGCGFELGRRLRPGDVVELEMGGIGILRNTVRQRARRTSRFAS